MRLIYSACLITLFSACSNKNDVEPTLNLQYTFQNGVEGWTSFFSDYPVGQETNWELEFKQSALPAPLDAGIKALKISGNNHSDDLFSAIVRKIDQLKPNHTYQVTFDVEVASNAQINGVGAGGSPNLALGAGGILAAPQNTIDGQNHYRPPFVSQLQSGLSNEVFKVLGTIGVSDQYPTPFTLVRRENLNNPVSLKTNNNGELWLMIATDSGFEGITTLYYKSIKVTLK